VKFGDRGKKTLIIDSRAVAKEGITLGPVRKSITYSGFGAVMLTSNLKQRSYMEGVVNAKKPKEILRPSIPKSASPFPKRQASTHPTPCPQRRLLL
jgi:hypothetical protein